MELCKAAFLFCGGAKLNKSIQSNIIEMLFLLMVIPRKVNFTQMGRYCKRGEPTQMEIAKVCGLSKAGLVYYFPFKQNSFGYCAQICISSPAVGKKVPIYSRFVPGVYRPVLRPCDFCPNPAQTCLRYA